MDVELVVRARSGDREAFGQLAALSISAARHRWATATCEPV